MELIKTTFEKPVSVSKVKIMPEEAKSRSDHFLNSDRKANLNCQILFLLDKLCSVRKSEEDGHFFIASKSASSPETFK